MQEVRTPTWVRVAVWTVVPLLGAALLLGVQRVAGPVAEWNWTPIRGVLRLIRDIPEPWATTGALVAGAVLGLILAGLADAESLTVRVTGPDLELIRPGVRRSVPRAEVTGAYLEKDRLVLLGRTGNELAREPCHLSRKDLAPLFGGYGVVWSDQDPYAGAYHRWIPDSPEVAAEANAVFAERQRALEKGDTRDADELRRELARRGYVIRDDRRKQHWRRAT